MVTMRRILYVQYTNPAGYPPLEHGSRLLADAGWQVLFLGTGAYGADRLEFPPHPNVTVRRRPYCPPGWRQKLHYLRYTAGALATACRWRPDWVYASDPLTAPAALALARLPGVRVVYHEHDSPAATGDAPASRFQRLVLRCRRALARRAALCVLPNEERLNRFLADTGRTGPTFCVWNCPDRDDAPAAPAAPTDRPGGLRVWYHGSLSPSQLPETLVRAVAVLPPAVSLAFAGYETVGHPGYAARLLDLAARLGVAERVTYRGTAPRRGELLEWCAAQHVGAALFPRTGGQPMTGASNKPFDYLACGLALLVPDAPAWRDLFVAPGYGRACDPDDPESIASALHWFLDHPELTRALGERGRRRVLDDWNYAVCFRPVLNLLGGAGS